MGSSLQKRSRLWRILNWELPGSYGAFKSNKAAYVRMLPELLHFEPGRERFEAFSQARTKIGLSKASFLGSGVILFVPLAIGRHLVGSQGGGLKDIVDRAFPLAFVGALGGWSLLVVWLWNRRLRRSLRLQARRKGVFLCIPCGYDLTGNVSGRCPECGAGVIPVDGC